MGINPSTAIPDRLDNTLKSVERIALANGYDSFLMFNVYAQRATDPDAMERRRNDILHQENLKAFQYLLSLSPQPAIWAAWGAIIEKRDYLATCLSDQIALGQAADAQWFTAGPISKGAIHIIRSISGRMRLWIPSIRNSTAGTSSGCPSQQNSISQQKQPRRERRRSFPDVVIFML